MPRRSAEVERLDLLARLAHHDASLQLQAGRELPALLGPLTGQDGELPDRLGLRDRLVGLVDRLLDRSDQVGVVDEVRRGPPDLPCCSAQAGNVSRSMVTSAPMNGCPSPTTRHWSTRAWARSRSSRTAGATFLPPAVTRISFLRPVMRTKPSSSTSPTSPVWNQPSRSTRLGGRLVVAPVAGEDLAAAEEQLPVVGHAHARAGQRTTDRPDLRGVGEVGGQGGRRLGQAVALEHGEADAAVEVAEPVAQRRAAGDGVRAAAAERLAQLAVDQPVEERVLRSQAHRHPLAVRAPATRRSRRRLRGRRSCPARRRWPAGRRC